MLPATILGSSVGFIDGSVVGFAAASLACGLAPNATLLIAARLAQGAAAALLTPASLAIIGAAYAGAARGPAIGTWAAAGALTTALGPPLGGWLVDTVGWRAIFFINLPLIAIALLMAARLPKDVAEPDADPIDKAGALLAVLTLGLASYGLIALGEGNAVAGAIALAAAIPTALLFIRVERHAREPMLPLALFASRDFSGANAITVLLYAALGGALFLLPFMLIQVHGYSATAAGAAFLPFSAIMGLGSRFTGGLADRFGAQLPLTIGPTTTAAGFALLAFTGHDPRFLTGFLAGLVLIGIGMTIAVPPLTTAVFAAAPTEQSGAASGVNNAAARTGGLLAVAALGLAFGGAAEGLAGAYRTVMLAAAVLAAASAVTAAALMTPKRQRPA